jgi:hypothetical protein
MKYIKQIIFVLLSVLCLLNIELWPVNKYEWMLLDDPEMTLPIDSNASLYSMFAVAPISFLLPFIAGVETKKAKLIIIMVISILIGIWTYKFNSSLF